MTFEMAVKIICSRSCIVYGFGIKPSLFGDQTRGLSFYFKRRFGLCKIFWRRCSKMAPVLELLCSLQWPDAYGSNATGWGSASLPGIFMRLVSKLWRWFMNFGRFINKKQGLRFEGHQFVGLHCLIHASKVIVMSLFLIVRIVLELVLYLGTLQGMSLLL